jgi:hypothetical protein
VKGKKAREVVEQLPGRQIVVEVRILRKKTGVEKRLRLPGRLAEDGGRAIGGKNQAGEDLERGGLAGAVRPQKSEHLSRFDA